MIQFNFVKSVHSFTVTVFKSYHHNQSKTDSENPEFEAWALCGRKTMLKARSKAEWTRTVYDGSNLNPRTQSLH